MKVKEYLLNVLKGAAIGVAVIIPGVSGGTLAVLTNVYDKIINCLGNLRKDFKNSAIFLSAILLGAVLALAAAYVPLNLALKYAPFPTVLLFVGFMAGSCPKLIKDAKSRGFKIRDLIAIIIPIIIVIGICFIPGLGDVDLSTAMPWYGFLLLVLMGVLASCALVIPGISGSMLMMLFGYYRPILASVKGIFETPLHSIGVLLCFGIGVIIGFFTVAKLMQILLKKFPRATYWAIVGFVLGSIPAILVVFNTEYGYAGLSGLHVGLGIVLCLAGAAATFFLMRLADKKAAQSLEGNTNELPEETAEETTEDTATNTAQDTQSSQPNDEK